MSIKPLVKAVAVCCLCLCLSGCVAIQCEVYDGVYALTHPQERKSYNEYVAGTIKTNQERYSQGLEPRPILSLDEWKKHQKELGKPEEANVPTTSPGK